MNIPSLNLITNNVFISAIITKFKSIEKKTIALAVGIFLFIALSYYFFRFCQFKATPSKPSDPVESKHKILDNADPAAAIAKEDGDEKILDDADPAAIRKPNEGVAKLRGD